MKLLPIWYQVPASEGDQEISQNRIQLLWVAEQLILSYWDL